MSENRSSVGEESPDAGQRDAPGHFPEQQACALACEWARQAAAWHAAGRWHRAIDAENASGASPADPITSEAGRSIRLGETADDWDRLPAELQRALPLELPVELDEARLRLQAASIALDPIQIDLHAIGTGLCRRLTGGSPATYRRSPRLRQLVPEELRLILDRALGIGAAQRYASAEELARALEPYATGKTAAYPAPAPKANAESSPVNRVSGSAGDSASGDTTPDHVSAANAASNTSILGATPGAADSTPRPSTVDIPFSRLGHYEVIRKLGHGGMGDVYLGYERALDREVAIKVLPHELARDDEFVRRFRTEATAVAKLVHPNIVQIHFIGEEAGHHFYVMQYVDGESLAERLVKRGQLAVEETLPIIEQVLAGLAAAHRLGLVHRDIKPGNILLDQRHQRALLADFGLVKSLQSSATGRTATGVIMGTADYISPEQGRGLVVDERSDLYSVGVLLYRMLSGRLPFTSDNPTALIFQHVYEPPPPLAETAPHVPAGLARMVQRLLEKSPADRHQSAVEVLDDIAAFRAGAPLPSEQGGRDSPSLTHAMAIIRAPLLHDLPALPGESGALPQPGWWNGVRDRAATLFRRHAPEAIQRLQTTQQQVDGAIAVCDRRRRMLQALVVEAEAVLGDLRSQGQRESEAAANDPLAQPVADEWKRLAAQQEEQLGSIRVRLAQVVARHEQLVNQRDLLNARLRTAEAGRAIDGGQVRSRGLPWRLASVGVTCFLLLLGAVLFPARTGTFFQSTTVEIPPQDETPAVGPEVEIAPHTPAPEEPSIALPVRQFVGHDKPVDSVAFNASGTLLAAASNDGKVRLWNPDTAALLQTLPAHKGGRMSIVFTPDGTGLVTSGSAGPTPSRTIRIWDPMEGREVRTLSGRTDSVSAIALAPNGRTLVAAYDAGAPLSVWDLAQGQEVRTIDPEVRPTAIAISPDGATLALAGNDEQVRLWNLISNEISRVLKGHKKRVGAIAFTGDGQRLYSGDTGGTVLQWTIRDSNPPQLLGEHAHSVRSLVPSANGRRLAVATEGSVVLWEISSRRLRKTIPGTGTVSIAYRSEQNLIATGGEAPFLTLWDARPEPQKVRAEAAKVSVGKNVPLQALAGSAISDRICVGGKTTIGVLRDKPSEFRSYGAVTESITALALTLDATRLVSGDDGGWLRLWDSERGTLIQQTNISPDAEKAGTPHNRVQTIRRLAPLPDGQLVLVVTATTAFIWDLSSGVMSHIFKGMPQRIDAVAVDNHGKFFATAGQDTRDHTWEVRLWDLPSGRQRQRLLGHPGPIFALALAPGGNWLATAGREALCFWKGPSGSTGEWANEPRQIADASARENWNAMAFSHDGALLATAGTGSLSLWEVASGEELLEFTPHRGPLSQITGLEFSHDDECVISVGTDGSIRWWPLSAVR